MTGCEYDIGCHKCPTAKVSSLVDSDRYNKRKALRRADRLRVLVVLVVVLMVGPMVGLIAVVLSVVG